jgi:hypothetical protein
MSIIGTKYYKRFRKRRRRKSRQRDSEKRQGQFEREEDSLVDRSEIDSGGRERGKHKHSHRDRDRASYQDDEEKDVRYTRYTRS